MTPDLTIERTEIAPLDIPLTDEFVISRGRMEVAENAFVSVTLRCGVTGYGEIAPFPALTGETRDTSMATARDLASIIRGRSASDHRSLAADLSAH
ncbi:MAG: dipeptide epimerase, partial [Candidatus Krumholzibacteriota bacterium]|nr:dipeptide epimerase [Candidatus Krumholzibacteriota bacterium]